MAPPSSQAPAWELTTPRLRLALGYPRPLCVILRGNHDGPLWKNRAASLSLAAKRRRNRAGRFNARLPKAISIFSQAAKRRSHAAARTAAPDLSARPSGPLGLAVQILIVLSSEVAREIIDSPDHIAQSH